MNPLLIAEDKSYGLGLFISLNFLMKSMNVGDTINTTIDGHDCSLELKERRKLSPGETGYADETPPGIYVQKGTP